MVSLEGAVDAVAKIPTVVVRWIIFPMLTVLSFFAWHNSERITALEQDRAVVAAQRAAEIRSIDALTTEVVGMRSDQQLQSRKQLELLNALMEGRRK